MSRGQERLLYVLLALCVWTFVLGLVTVVMVSAGLPPRHCRYLVPVVNRPHVLACSEYRDPVFYRP